MSAHHEVFQPILHRRLHQLLWLAALAILFLLSAVVIFKIPRSGNDVGTRAATIQLTQPDSGSTVNAESGDRMVIQLPSNASTGYTWDIDEIDRQALAYVENVYQDPQNGLVGQEGVQKITFEAVERGESELVLKYWRPQEGDSSIADRFTVTIVVNDGE